MSFSPGTRLGPHEILAPLGKGGMGEVYRARYRPEKIPLEWKVTLSPIVR